MEYKVKFKVCADKDCNAEFIPRVFNQKHCCPEHFHRNQKPKPARSAIAKKQAKPIPKQSAKMKKKVALYLKQRHDFLNLPENKICFIEGCGRSATTVEHRRGHKGFADEWARENGIELKNDVRFFAPCCHHHNLELERNPELSKQYQLSKIHGGKKE